MIICPHHCNPGGIHLPPMARNTFGNASARLDQRLLSLPDSVLAQAACTEANSLPSVLSSVPVTTSAEAAVVSFASSSSPTSTSKRRAKPPTLRGRNRRGGIEVIRLSLNMIMDPRGQIDVDRFWHAVRFNLLKSFTKNCEYVGFKPKSCACIPGVVLRVPAIIPRKPWLLATSLMCSELLHLMSSSC